MSLFKYRLLESTNLCLLTGELRSLTFEKYYWRVLIYFCHYIVLLLMTHGFLSLFIDFFLLDIFITPKFLAVLALLFLSSIFLSTFLECWFGACISLKLFFLMKYLYSPSILKERFTGYIDLGWNLFAFKTLHSKFSWPLKIVLKSLQ